MGNELEVLRHSTSHIMAHAVKILFPDAKLAIGPPIKNGFYYDILFKNPIREDDLKEIEEKMKEIIHSGFPFLKKKVSKNDAIKLFEAKKENFKLEILSEIHDDTVSLYQHSDFIDLCKGPHLNSTSDVKAFKLLSIAGAYWRGDEKREMLQRIYGTAFFSKKDLELYLERLEEAKKRDHRKLGRELELFDTYDDIGAGLIHWLPKGAVLKRIIEDMWYKIHLENGYELVSTPHIVNENIYVKSGHLENYTDMMYSSIDIEGVKYRVKPMNCPSHIMIYKSKPHSYRELPVRFAEIGTVYRNEKSGVLHGLLRVRGITIDDAHIFCRYDQVEEEILGVFNLAVAFLNKFGFKNFSIYIATKPNKAIGSNEEWEKATNSLVSAVEKAGYSYHIDKGGGAFYGPKVDIKIKDALSREWQCTTIQFDFNLPERFNLKFKDKDGKLKNLYMVHRAILGSIERFIGVLIEHYKGAFPYWLAPVQVVVMSITDKQKDYVQDIYKILKTKNVRVKLDIRNEKIGYKIREAQMKKVPYTIIIGDEEVRNKTISVRKFLKGDIGKMRVDEFLGGINNEKENKFI